MRELIAVLTSPDDRAQLDRVVAAVRDALADDLTGAYLFGSAVVGGLRPRSDLDVLAVSRRRTTPAQKRLLVDRLLAVSGRRTPAGRWRHVEVTVVVEPDIRPWRYPPRVDFQYGDWLRPQFEAGALEPSNATDPDLAVLIAMVLRDDSALLGPPPAAVLDPVPHADLVRAIVSGVDGLVADLDDDTANVLLTLARIWSTLVTGDLRPKDAAADWALARLPAEQRAPLARARAVYLGAEDRWEDLRARIGPHARHLVAEIERARHGDGRAIRLA